MVLLHPAYLLLALPLAASLWVWGFRARWLLGFRIGALLLIVLALAGLALDLPSRAGTVIVVADRSFSMPPDSAGVQREAIDLIQQAMGATERLGVVAFGRQVAVERAPQQDKFAGFIHEVGRDASHLGEAIETALSLIPHGAPGRVLVLSDGQWTGRDPGTAAARAAERGIPLDFRSMRRPSSSDVAIARVDAPSAVGPGESFLMTAWIHAPARQEVAFELRRGNTRIAGGKRLMDTGLNRLTFRDQAGEPGTQTYHLVIAAKENNAVHENDTARVLVGVHGPRPILVVTSPASGFAELLQAGGLNIKALRPDQCEWTLEALSNYAAVILENTPADRIGPVGMETLAAWVQQTGSGLMLTGGRASYGPGGYFKSPLDPLLPVSMELRQEHRKLSLAIVVTLDRSGSMAMAVGGGRVKMDLANLGTVQVLDLLSPADEFGCIAVDSAPHTVQELAPVKNKSAVRSKILSINSQGGGIFVFEALAASLAMLEKARAGTRHVILFADAADAEEPKEYEKLLAHARAQNITVSVIGLGNETDKDGMLLKDIAARGNGRVFFTNSPEDLPRLFAQDTFVVARSAFLDEPTPIKTTAGIVTLTGKDFNPPALGGYNLCYLRPSANLAGVTLDEYKAPVVASWQAGAGRVLCYTGEADGEFTGALADWPKVGDFFTSLARWTAGRTGELPGNMLLTQDVKKGVAHVQLHLDPERKTETVAGRPEVAVLRAAAGKKPKTEKLRLQWISPDTLAVEVPLYGGETALATVDVPGHGAVPLPPVCLPYSPEFEPALLETSDPSKDDQPTARWGATALERLARSTGGKERIEVTGVWRDIPRYPRIVPLGAWLIIAAMVLILLEVLERLTALLSRGGRVMWNVERAPAPRPRAVAAEVAVAGAAPVAKPPATEGAPPTESAAPRQAPGILEALRQAQERTRRRK
jgi:hypothetical protein